MAVETSAPATRRSILAAGLGGLVALVAAALGRPSAVRATDGLPVNIGQANTGNTETSLENQDAGEISFKAKQTTGTALRAETSGGTAVSAADAGAGKGVAASSNTSTGVDGSSTYNTPSAFPAGVQSNRSGVLGTVGDLGVPGNSDSIALNTDEVGVYGYANVSENSTGVWGDSWGGWGVAGTGAYGVFGNGSYGVVGTGDSYGVYGTTNTPNVGYALYTNGKIKFNGRSGRSYVSGGRNYKDILVPGMTSSSAVIATLQTNRAGFYVQSVVSYTGKFRLYLNRVAPGVTTFSYLVIG